MLVPKKLTALITALVFLAACQKEKMPTPTYATNTGSTGNNTTTSVSCGTRPLVEATLVPIGILSSARIQVFAAAAADKIVFIGGVHEGPNYWNEDVPVDIYDIPNNTWTTHYLTANGVNANFRWGAAIASVGTKILFAGGGDPIGDNQTSAVNIYDASSGSWSTAQLSTARVGLAAATVGKKVLFAGGGGYPVGSDWGYFNTVDIYDDSTHSWSTATLSQGRMDITSVTVGNKVYFAGGRIDADASRTIDVYDMSTGSWSISSLQLPRTSMAATEAGGKIFWAGGANKLGPAWSNNSNVEILDLNTGASSLECMIPKLSSSAVKSGDKIIFFTGSDRTSGDQFEIYDAVAANWSIGVLNQKVQSAAIISVDNTIYVAGGIVDGIYSRQVWKLKF